MQKSIIEKINQSFDGKYKNIVCDWYFQQVESYIRNKTTLDYGSGNRKIVDFCNVYTSDIQPNGFYNEIELDYIIDKHTGILNTDKKFDVITILRNYILYSDIDYFVKTVKYLTQLLNDNGFLLIGKHTVYDDFGDWNLSIEEWLNTNAKLIDLHLTKFWILNEDTFNSNSST